MQMTIAETFAERLRARESLVGYWSMLDSAVAIERLARVGYDYVCVDAQHGFGGYPGLIHGLIAIDAAATSAALVRVAENSPMEIARALDAGASGVIVPLINSAADAEVAARSCRYPPRGIRSYGPIRSRLGRSADTTDRDRDVVCLAMVETADGLANVEAVAEVAGVDGLYVGPSDLSLVLGARFPGDPLVTSEFERALVRIRNAAEASGKAVGIHCASGEAAAKRLAEGFTFASVASDIVHLEAAATAHLAACTELRGGPILGRPGA
nr:aldolase/citrate lyase family protein [Cellulomonas sp. KRMCY2]